MSQEAESDWTHAKNTTTEGDLAEGKTDVQAAIAKAEATKRASIADALRDKSKAKAQ